MDRDFSLEVNDLNNRKQTVSIMMDKGAIARIVNRPSPYKALPYRMRPALEKVADYVRTEMIPEVFQQEGPGWAKLSRRTIADRLKLGYQRGPILQRSRDLFRELTQKSHPNHVEIIVTGRNARIEIGGSSKKFLENQQGVSSQNLPARPMIPGTNAPIPHRHVVQIEKILYDAIKRALR